MGHPPAAAKSLRWILASILAGSITLSLGYLVYQCHRNPDIAFIFPGREAHWIQYPPTIKTQAKLPNRDVITFRKKFNLENRPQPPVQIYFQALKEAELWVNGRKLWQTPPGFNWKERRSVEISDALKAGPNVVEVHVRHRLGPPRLYLSSPAGITPLVATEPAGESVLNGTS